MTDTARATHSGGLRQRKKDRTRTELVEAANRLFAARGFDAVTIDEIADAADVSPRTFYRYFSSKEALVLGEVDESLDAIREALQQRPDDEPVLASMRAIVLAMADEIESERDANRSRIALLDATASLQLRQTEREAVFEAGLAPIIAQRIGSTDPTDLRPALIAACAAAAIRVAVSVWIAGGGVASLSDLVDQALGLLSEGLEQQGQS